MIIAIALLIAVKYRAFWLILISILPLVLPIHERWFFFFIKHWPEFCLGIITYRLIHFPKQEVWQNAILTILTLVGLFTIPLLKYYPYATVITATLIILNHFKPLKNNLFSQLGDYSYSTYLIHVPVGVFILGYVKQLHYVQAHVWVNMLWDVFLLAIIIMLSKVMYLYIELPSIKKGKMFANKYAAKTHVGNR